MLSSLATWPLHTLLALRHLFAGSGEARIQYEWLEIEKNALCFATWMSTQILSSQVRLQRCRTLSRLLQSEELGPTVTFRLLCSCLLRRRRRQRDVLATSYRLKIPPADRYT